MSAGEEKEIEEMAREGQEAHARADSEAVLEILELFVEVLGYEFVPAEATVNDFIMFGACHQEVGDEKRFGPIVMFNDQNNALRVIKRTLSAASPTARDLISGVAQGEIKPDVDEFGVFQFLKQEVLKKDADQIKTIVEES